MKKILSFICFLFIGSQFVVAQKTIYDKKIIADYLSLVSRQIIATNDGGLAFYEGHLSKSPTVSGQSIFSLDKNGNITAGKTFTTKIGSNIGRNNIKQLKDNSFLLSYEELDKAYYPRVHLCKTDVNFKPIWDLNIGFNSSRINIDKILELENGNILIVGLSEGSGSNSNYYFYAEISPNGDVIRKQRYNQLCSQNYCVGYVTDAKVSPDGKLFLALIGSYPTSFRSTILSLDIATGKILFTKLISFGSKSYCSIFSIYYDDRKAPLSDQIIFFEKEDALFAQYRVSVMAIDAEKGLLQSSKSYMAFEDYAGNFIQKEDGSLFANFNSKGDAYNINFDKQGNIISANKELKQPPTFLQNISAFKEGKSVIQLKDGRVVTVSDDKDCQNKGQYIMRFRGKEGESTCFVPYTPEELFVTPTISSKSVMEINTSFVSIVKDTFPRFLDYKPQLIDKPLSCQKDTFNVKLCFGNQYSVGKKIYTKSGIYLDTLKSNDCDSIFYTMLSIPSKIPVDSIQKTFCKGEKFIFLNKNYDTEGIFEIKLKTQFGCDSILFLNLKTEDFELFSLPDLTIKSGVETQLEVKANATNLSWQWLPNTYLSCSDCAKPIVKPLESINYTIQAKSKSGCVAKGNQKITVLPCNFVFVPNAFSPNGDGINDRLTVNASDCATSIKRYQIYDRWGELVYDRSDIPANDSEYGWDGKFKNKSAASGVYVYRLQVEFANGKIQNLSGDVLLSN